MEQVKRQHLEALLIVSEVELREGEGAGYAGQELPGVSVEVSASELPKCPRCWTRSATVGQSAAYPELCGRCAAALEE